MPTTVSQTCDIQIVSAVSVAGEEAEVCFNNGDRMTVAADHPDRDMILRNAENSLRRQTPVGFLCDGTGRITDLNYTYEVTVRFVHDDEEDSNRLFVGFWEFSEVCYLIRDHPDFQRIRETLEAAQRSGGRVVFANHMWPRESETEVWNSILDVRPLTRPANAADRNGTD